MIDLITRQHHRIGPRLLRNAISKAEIAQFQLWDHGASSQPLGIRQIESMSAVLLAWVAIEAMVNEVVFVVFDGAKAPLPKGARPTHENRLRECIRVRLGSERVMEFERMLERLAAARRIRNDMVHYSAHREPTELRWSGMVLPGAIGWMVAAPPSDYSEGIMERIDPERAWQFCTSGIEVGSAVYGSLNLDPNLGEAIGKSVISMNLLPLEPTLADLMNGIPIWQIERYWRALRVAEQYTDQWWVLQPDGRRRPYRPGEDLNRETLLTAFEGDPSPEALGDLWDDYYDSIPPLAMKTKRIVKNEKGDWTLAPPLPSPIMAYWDESEQGAAESDQGAAADINDD